MSLKEPSWVFLWGVVFGSALTLLFVYYAPFADGAMRSPFSVIHRDQKVAEESGKGGVNCDGQKPTNHHDRETKESVNRTSEEVTRTSEEVNRTSENYGWDQHNNVTAEYLYEKVRVLCWVMTSPDNLYKRAVHVRDTWTKRCNIRLFMSSVENKEFPTIGLPGTEGRGRLYEKTKAAFKYAWEHYKDEADWFMKADDDTYTIVENLRLLLKDYDPKKPIYFGRRFKPFVKQGYMSGGAGYVLSRAAVERYLDGLNTKKCAKGGSIEDVEIGKCLELVGVEAGDSRDSNNLKTFHPLSARKHLGLTNIAPSLPEYNFYPACKGLVNCTSDYPISFHRFDPEEMHVFDFMIYNVKVYGFNHIYKRYPKLGW